MKTQSDSLLTEPWLSWAIEIQSIAQNGLTYCKNIYDIERYERLRDLSAEMLAYKTAIPKETVKSFFCNEAGYQTPKIDSRAAIFKDDKILLVQENDGRWSLPGGWIDVLETIHSNTIKEVREEAGLNVKPTFIIAIHEQHKRNFPPFAHPVLKTFVMCEPLSGEFQPNSETVQSAYFALSELPPMNEEKNTPAQVELCFQAHHSFYALDMRQNAQPVVDCLHVYNVDNTRNHHEARKLEICWDESGYLALLLINGYPHAVFDFAHLIGYNTNKHPQPDLMSMWTHEEITNERATAWLGVNTIK